MTNEGCILEVVLRVREVESADAAAVAQIHVQARSAYYAAAGVDQDDREAVSYGERATMWEHFVAEPKATVLGADDDGTLVGFIAWASTPKASEVATGAIELLALYVRPNCWGQRIGGQLYELFAEHLAAQTVGRGVLDVWNRNERALGFYRRRGWRGRGTIRPGPLGAPFVTLQLAL